MLIPIYYFYDHLLLIHILFLLYEFPGLACIILAVVIYVIDLFRPTATASFFNIDILASFEDEVLVKSAAGDEDQNEANGDAHEMKPVEGNANGDTRPEDPDGHYKNVEVCTAIKHMKKSCLKILSFSSSVINT